MKSRRHSLLVGAMVLLVVVIAMGVALAVAAPVLIVVGLAAVTFVVGLVTRAPRPARRRRATGRGGVSDGDDHTRTGSSGPRWVMQWETRPPVDAVPFARDQLARVLTDWGLGTEAAEPALLVATELLTNAVEHARAPIRLTVGLAADCVRVEVHDAAPDPPRQQPHDLWAPRGRGLQLVDALSRQWGWSPAAGGKTVWADVSSGWPP